MKKRPNFQVKGNWKKFQKRKNYLWFLQVPSLFSNSVRQNAVWTSLDFPGLLLVFVEIMPDEVILDNKKLYLVSFENFHFFQFLAKNWP